VPKPRNLQSDWRLVSINRTNGAVLAQQNLPSEALPGGLLVDGDGRIVVVMRDGAIACFGGGKALEATVARVIDLARQGNDQAAAVGFLRRALNQTQTFDGRTFLLKQLASLGVDVTEKGVNKIVMKVTQLGSAWAFSVRLTDQSGSPVNLANQSGR